MKKHPVLFFLLLVSQVSFAQAQGRATEWGDGEVAQQYVLWVQQVIKEGNWSTALAALNRANDFANVSSDISYLLALARSHNGMSRANVVEALETALQTNRWVFYNAIQAQILKVEQLIIMRRFTNALAVLEHAGRSADAVNYAADLAMLHLLALRGLAADNRAFIFNQTQVLAQFHSHLLSAMNRFPRDPRPLRIFFEYARIRSEHFQNPSSEIEFQLRDLTLRRLPFLLETDPELAWMAAPLIQDVNEARRLVASYRAGGRDFMPHPGSIPPALNLGLITDRQATDELFSGTRGFNAPRLPVIAANAFEDYPVLDRRIINEVFALLRREEEREYFTQRLLSFSGAIIADNDNDGYFESLAFFRSGIIREYWHDRFQVNVFDLRIVFSPDGIPVSAELPVTGLDSLAQVQWERYPSLANAALGQETFYFRPADFQFAPVEFTVLGGTRNFAGLVYPVLSERAQLTRRLLISSAASLRRPGVEFDNSVEEIFLERGLPLRAVETINGNIVSLTGFERGLPVIQYIDLDLDGRMETIRRFHRPDPAVHDFLDWRRLIASYENDWTSGSILNPFEERIGAEQ